MGKRPINAMITEQIQLAWLELKDEQGKDPTAYEVLPLAQLAWVGKTGKALDRSTWPKIRKVQMIIKDFKERYERLPIEYKTQDKPWSIGQLDKYNVESSAIRVILMAQIHIKCTLAESLKGVDHTSEPIPKDINYLLNQRITLRQAKWISRLHKVLNDDTELTYELASEYARHERLCEILDIPFDSTELDKGIEELLFNNPMLHSGAPSDASGENKQGISIKGVRH